MRSSILSHTLSFHRYEIIVLKAFLVWFWECLFFVFALDFLCDIFIVMFCFISFERMSFLIWGCSLFVSPLFFGHFLFFPWGNALLASNNEIFTYQDSGFHSSLSALPKKDAIPSDIESSASSWWVFEEVVLLDDFSDLE